MGSSSLFPLPLSLSPCRPRILAVSQYPKPSFLSRRSLLFLSTSLRIPTPLSLAEEPAATAPPPPADATPPAPDITITDRVFLDFSICPNYFRSERSLADDPTTCLESQPLGRLVLGLYGKLVPITVANFKSMCTGSAGSSYRGTLVHKIFPGQYFVAGKQGRRDKGEVQPPQNLASNSETVDSKAFLLKHLRAGTVSLCLSENDDEDDIKLDPNYRNVEFLITTGPGPCPQLDSQNIVFGTVLEVKPTASSNPDILGAGLSRGLILAAENRGRSINCTSEFILPGLLYTTALMDGLDVVTTIATIPTYKPSERIRQLNDLAEFFGDERAQNARTVWDRPLKTIYISDCGELKVAKPSLSPSLP